MDLEPNSFETITIARNRENQLRGVLGERGEKKHEYGVHMNRSAGPHWGRRFVRDSSEHIPADVHDDTLLECVQAIGTRNSQKNERHSITLRNFS